MGPSSRSPFRPSWPGSNWMIIMVLWELHNHHPKSRWHGTTALLCPQVLWVRNWTGHRSDVLPLLSGPQVRVILKGLEDGGSASKRVSSRSSWPWAARAEAVPPVPTGRRLWHSGLLRCQLDSILIFRKWVPPFLLEGRRLRRNPLEQLHSLGALGWCRGKPWLRKTS